MASFSINSFIYLFCWGFRLESEIYSAVQDSPKLTVVQAVLKFMVILLPQLLKCWGSSISHHMRLTNIKKKKKKQICTFVVKKAEGKLCRLTCFP